MIIGWRLSSPEAGNSLVLWMLHDADIHAFLFEHDGTYVDCVFYKNPTLAGKSVRLLQQEQELLVDLRYIPQRCSFIVCTLAIYTGGTVAQLADGTVQVSTADEETHLGQWIHSCHFVTANFAVVALELVAEKQGLTLKSIWGHLRPPHWRLKTYGWSFGPILTSRC